MLTFLHKFWNEVSVSGIRRDCTDREKREIILLNRAWAIVALIQMACLLIHLLNSSYRSGMLTAFYLDGLIAVYILIRTGWLNVAKISALIVINVNTIIMAVLLGEHTQVIDFLLLIALAPMYLFEVKNRKLIFWGVAVSILPYAFYHFMLPYFRQYSLPVEEQLKIYESTPWIMVSCLVALLYLIYSKNANHEKEMQEKEQQLIGHIANIKEAEKKLKEYALELEKKNADMHHFVNATSHDLKTPLRTIVSYLQVVQKNNLGKLDDDSLSMISYTVKSVKRLNRLINDIYLYSVADKGQKPAEVIDMNALLSDILKQSITQKADIKVGELPVLKVAPSNMETIFSNLIENGIKYNTSGNPIIKVNCKHTDKEFIFCITDNGIGIKPEYHKQIFQMFKRLHTSEEFEGTGVGLAICNKIAENYGGRMWVESESGKGSTFYFSMSKDKVNPDNSDIYQIQPYKKLAAAG